MNNYTELEIAEFAKNAKFRTAKSGLYTFFNPNATSQIRIKKGTSKTVTAGQYFVTIHQISDDNITFNEYDINVLALSLKEAKIEAGKLYYNEIRK